MGQFLQRLRQSVAVRKTASVGDIVRRGELTAQRAWQFTVAASGVYQKALDLHEGGIEAMEQFDTYIAVTLPDHREVYLVPKHTCGVPYGAGWKSLIQARLPEGSLPGIGGGTTLIAALTLEDQKLVCQAIARGNTRIMKGHIWP